ncbi:histidine kinase [Streptomyces bambusae]|nr:histidine kinase [Streptomyces bambusae]MCB5163360.1 histidine kinase [Streptomyces bambusae]
MAAGVEDLAGDPAWMVGAASVAVAPLSLLRRRLPAGVLVVSCALAGALAGMAPVSILAGWTAGRRIVGVVRALFAFTLAFVLTVAVSLVTEAGQGLRVLPMLFFSALLFLGTTVVPGLAGRYWNQRRTLLHALQDRNAQLLREREMVSGQARLRERQRIAQDMHDSLGHQLALIAVHTGALEVDPELTGRQREAVGVLRQASVAAMHELREVVGILRDGVEAPAGDDAGPAGRGVAGVAEVVAAARAAGTDVRLARSGVERPLAAACDHAAYRIVQEALTNAYKHAPGAAIAVELRYEDDSLVVEIANGPAAGPAGEVVSGGQGLTGLRERARLVGGMVHAGPLPDGGFRVAGVLPYGAEAAGPVVAPVDAADDFGQQAPAVPLWGQGAPVDWGAVDKELAVEVGRSRGRAVALGCGIAVAALVVLVIAAGVLLFVVIDETQEASIDQGTFDGVKVGTAEAEVRGGLPEGSAMVTSGLGDGGPARPAGAECLVLLDRAYASDVRTDRVFRFCFRDGKLVQKSAYEVDR